MQEFTGGFRLTGPDVTQNIVFVPRSGWKVGRTADNNLILPHPQISKQHMRLFWQDGSFWVEDLGSTNGVWINDRRLEPRSSQKLLEGYVIIAGPFTLTYEGGFQQQSQAIAPAVDPTLAVPGVVELPSVLARRTVSPHTPIAPIIPKVRERDNRYAEVVTRERSNWLQYLPAIYSDSDLDPLGFTGRYLLIFESLLGPIIWMVDNFDLYLSPETAPPEWMQWIASWFDITIFPELPVAQQQAIMRQIAWLYLRRGTRSGLERLLELCFGVMPEIIEDQDDSCHFTVRLPLSQSKTGLDVGFAERIIESQKPAFTTYTLLTA